MQSKLAEERLCTEQLHAALEQCLDTPEQKGLRKLRHPQNARRLEPYREQIITTHAYHGTGFSAWKYGGSVEERIIERPEL
ncbi:MAG: hypothetical protein Q4C72_05635 [Eubacteriales bacterium]|nr:hypothetical protein [Eubacteriales bacterium]